ncbi:MAG: FAD-dependent oxidoreductase, partial [Pseudomonadota bacterium]
MTADADIIIVGAGIAGASLAWAIGDAARTILLEGESHPGVHATGRSAAFYAETYGGPRVQPLTTASKAFFHAPPPEVAPGPLVTARGALHIAVRADPSLDALAASFRAAPVATHSLDAEATHRRLPILAPQWSGRSLWEPECQDIDVAALHAGFLTAARHKGASILTDARVTTVRHFDHLWIVETAAGTYAAPILVDAAGAWA